jgi:hypothetical protein
MFLKDRNGNRKEVNLRAPAPPPQARVVELYENKPEGSNKMLLYIALFVGLAIAIGSGYILLKGNKKQSVTIKSRENFGYHL